MARQVIDIGVQGNDGTGDSIRESFRKVNENFTQLFAVFGQGDRIAFTDLDDTPNGYSADQVIVSNNEGDSLVAKSLVGGEGISVDFSDENEIRIISTGGRVSNDIRPILGGHLNAERFSVGNLADPTDETADLFNVLHNTTITADSLALTRGYADRRYIQTTGTLGTGSQVRIREEPLTPSEYQILITDWLNGYAFIPDHGFNSGFDGAEFKYSATGQSATGINSETIYFLKYVDKDRLSLHLTKNDAIEGNNRVLVNLDPELPPSIRGIEYFLDVYYDPTLFGNWVSNEALPRKSVVRRQGDTMEGPLYLNDHPGSLAGSGTPTGIEDLQAATKFYVDNTSFASATNLFVAPSGDDNQTNTPPGKEGRAFAYAYATINAACQKAEELINEGLTEPGPYRQVITYGDYVNNSYLDNTVVNLGNQRTLKIFTNGQGVDQSKNIENRDLREGSIIKGLHSGATGKVISYDGISGLNDEYVVELLHSITDVTNFQSNYRFASDRLLSNKEFIVAETVEYIKSKYQGLEFNETKCARDAGLIVDAIAFDIKFGGNNKTIKAARSYWNGVSSVLPVNQRLETVDGIDYIFLLAEKIIDNDLIDAPTEITGEDADFGKRTTLNQDVSGTPGEEGSIDLIDRLISSITNIILNGVKGDGTLLEFLDNESLEFGQPVPELQISIRVESGIYYEQLPIRVPTNVSIKGDEFRRSIVRPAPGVSTSPWANMYFYRDSEFDGLTRTYISPADANSEFVPEGTDFAGSPAYWKITVSDVEGLEVGMALSVIAGAGSFRPNTRVVRVISSTEFEINQEPTTQLVNATVRGLNSNGLAPVGVNFGYHYLTDPSGVSGIFNESILKTSGNNIAANTLSSNKNFIKDEVIRYINAKYQDFDYNQDLCARDVGLIVDALIFDLVEGGTARSVAAAQSYTRNVSSRIAITTQLSETLDGINYIALLASPIISNIILTAPSTFSGPNASLGKRGTELQLVGGTPEAGAVDIVTDLINGIKNTIIGSNNPPKENKDMDVFMLNDACILRNITCQGHGGFMCVLDPEGQIQTKSPYFQTNTSLSGSTNKQRFAGGMLIDGFCGNLPARIISKNSNTELIFDGLLVREPGVPNSFYIDGFRYQINAVKNYNKVAGTATITLDASTPYLPTVTIPVGIVIETPGNRSMLGNDFTQVNDLGYGVVATNNGISELVSVFTYYNWASYYAVNGGQIRSLNGSSCNGIFGLKANGRDPNEVADPVTLVDNTVQVAKIFKRSSFAGRNLAGDGSIYIDNYDYIPYNISEVEIDHSNRKSTVVVNTPSSPDNLTIVNRGDDYSIGDVLEFVGGEVYPARLPTRVIVISIQGGGATGPIEDFEVIEPGTYLTNPVGGYPTVTGIVTTTTTSLGSGATFNASYLGDISTYEVSNIELTTNTGVGIDPGGIVGTRTVLKLNLNTEAGENSAGLLQAPLIDGQTVIIRGLQNFRFDDVEEVKPVRPSTALEFTDPQERSVYRTLAYGLTFPTGGALPSNQAILSFDNSFNYAIIETNPNAVEDTDYVDGGAKTMGSTAGDTRIAVNLINSENTIARLNSGDMILGWAGKLHVVESYTAPNGDDSAYITILDKAYGDGSIVNTGSGIAEPISNIVSIKLRAGLPAGEPAEITVNISTCRATGHDFLDIGTGGYNDTNYPTNILGAPAKPLLPANEAVEETQGRVFYVSTDQNGIFRVGKFFTVDQGTGTVTFSASIALSNLDGIGFKRGTVVKEFSTDVTFTDNADDAVPTEAAVQGYVNRRLGYDRDGNPLDPLDILPAGGGFLPVTGSPTLAADLNMGGGTPPTPRRIINLASPVNNSDASNKGYVDAQDAITDSFNKLKQVILTNPGEGDIPVFTGFNNIVVKGIIGGDLSSSIESPITATLANPINSTLQTAVSSGIIVGAGETAAFPSSGFLQIGTEIFSYNGKTDVANRFDGVTRARISSNNNSGFNVDLTTATTHSAGATVKSLNSAEINLQIKPNTIVNADVNDTAAISQSKLSMNSASTRSSAVGITQADKGIASFDSNQFNTTDGWATIKDNGISLGKIAVIDPNTILGNLSVNSSSPVANTLSSVIEKGINESFTNIRVGNNVLTKRNNSLISNPTFSNIQGKAIAGTGSFQNVPISSLTGNGNGAIATVTYAGESYTNITITFGGNGYTAGDQLIIKGRLLGGVDTDAPVGNDLKFTVTSGDIDSNVYFGIQKVSITAEPNSIVQTDFNGNLGNTVNRFNVIYANTFDGTVLSASSADNLSGGVTGSIPYQNDVGETAFIAPGTTGRYLRTQGPGLPPTWGEIAIPDGTAENLLGTTIASNVINSSLVTLGNLQSLVVEGLVQQVADENITASGTTQATATQITKNINIVTSVPTNSGIRMPVAAPGYRIIIKNTTSNPLNLYPASGARINSLVNNEAFVLPAEASLEFYASSATQWYTLNATFA
jgi:hypothetical protein